MAFNGWEGNATSLNTMLRRSATDPLLAWRTSQFAGPAFDGNAGTDGAAKEGLSGDEALKLRRFCELVGLEDSAAHVKADAPDDVELGYCCFTVSRKAYSNVGMYWWLVKERNRAAAWYFASTCFANVLLALQLCIAATLTAIGASSIANNGTAVTTLDAINTIVAAALAFLKAKGLPNSAMVYRDKLDNLKADIDDTVDAYSAGVTGEDPQVAISRMRKTLVKLETGFSKNVAGTTAGNIVSPSATSPTRPAAPVDPAPTERNQTQSQSNATAGHGIAGPATQGQAASATEPGRSMEPSEPDDAMVGMKPGTTVLSSQQ